MLSLDYTVLTETKACPLQSQNSYSAFLCRIRDGLAQTHQREKRQKEKEGARKMKEREGKNRLLFFSSGVAASS